MLICELLSKFVTEIARQHHANDGDDDDDDEANFGCIDLATKNNRSTLEGPIFIRCKNIGAATSTRTTQNFLTKCCRGNQFLDLLTRSCVDLGLEGGLIPPRLVRNHLTMEVETNLNQKTLNKTRLCRDGEVARFVEPAAILTNGSVLLRRKSGYQLLNYECVGRTTTSYFAAVCAGNKFNLGGVSESLDDDQAVEIPKCCSKNSSFDVKLDQCVSRRSDNVDWDLENFLPMKNSSSEERRILVESKMSIINLICLPRKTKTLDRNQFDGLEIVEGQLQLTIGDSRASIPPGHFCLESATGREQVDPSAVTQTEPSVTQTEPSVTQTEPSVTQFDPSATQGDPQRAHFVIVTCEDVPVTSPGRTNSSHELCSREIENFEAFNKICRSVYTFAGVFSLFFIAFTLYLYLTLPKLRNAQGNIVIANLVSTFFATSALILSYNAIPNGFIEEPAFVIEKPVCIILGYLLYFFGLSMFCWMAALGFDLFLTFGPKKFQSRIRTKQKRLLVYAFLGIGIPFVMLTTVVTLELLQVRRMSNPCGWIKDDLSQMCVFNIKHF